MEQIDIIIKKGIVLNFYAKYFHLLFSCVGVQEHQASDIEIYHCPNCQLTHGPLLCKYTHYDKKIYMHVSCYMYEKYRVVRYGFLFLFYHTFFFTLSQREIQSDFNSAY